MEQPPEVTQDNATTTTVSLGTTLREARERLGLSVADVANQTKLAVRQITALEADDLTHLPEMPFVRGFVRSYAKILHLEPQPLLAFLPQPDSDKTPLTLSSVEAPFPDAHTPQRQNLILLGSALLLAVLVVAFAVWNFTAPPDKTAKLETSPVQIETPRVQVETPVPLPAAMLITQAPLEAATSGMAQTQQIPLVQPQIQAVQPAAQTAVHDPMLRLVFEEDSWTEIRDKDGKILSSQSNPRGSELALNGKAPFSLVVGHAASVKLYYRGKQIDLASHIKATSDVARLTLE